MKRAIFGARCMIGEDKITVVPTVKRGEVEYVFKTRYQKGRLSTVRQAGGLPDSVPDDAPFYVKDYFDYYKTARGYHPRSLNSNNGWAGTSSLSLINMPILAYAGEIRNAVLMIHGEKAHSCYFSRDAFKKLKGDNKELMIIPGAVHTDLYDRTDIIPFDKIESFYRKYLG